jgi:esterase/lipase superfamily enzyme
VKVTSSWYSERLQQPIGVARWGHYGTPVLVFPTAGGDAEEIERNGLIDAIRPMIDGGRIKVYSCDSVAGQALVAAAGSVEYRMWLADQYHHCVLHEVVPAIRTDLGGSSVPIVTAGASIGAFNAVAVMCRFPEVFRAAIGMSGTYRLQRFFDGRSSPELEAASPIDFLPHLDGERLGVLRQRFAILASGQGAHEDLGESWAVADALGRQGVPNRVDPWGPEWPHEWHTWRRMLPQYLDELC